MLNLAPETNVYFRALSDTIRILDFRCNIFDRGPWHYCFCIDTIIPFSSVCCHGYNVVLVTMLSWLQCCHSDNVCCHGCSCSECPNLSPHKPRSKRRWSQLLDQMFSSCILYVHFCTFVLTVINQLRKS